MCFKALPCTPGGRSAAQEAAPLALRWVEVMVPPHPPGCLSALPGVPPTQHAPQLWWRQVVTHLCYSDFEDIMGAIDGLDGELRVV